jgi:hypothetical protein
LIAWVIFSLIMVVSPFHNFLGHSPQKSHEYFQGTKFLMGCH